MSLKGPKKDKVRLAIQPLLDAIAPECMINALEREKNSSIPPRGWQDDFFEKKVRAALNIDVLELNGAWDENTPSAQKLNMILAFLFEEQTNSSLTEYAQSLLAQGANYIRDLHMSVKSHFSSEKQLDYSKSKALVAFRRLVNVQLAFNAIALLKEGGTEEVDNRVIMARLERYIQTQTTFTFTERVRFRFAKAIKNAVSLDLFDKDYSRYPGGRRLDRELDQLGIMMETLEKYPLNAAHIRKSFWQSSGNILRTALLGPGLFMLKTSHYLNQVTALPFRFFKGIVQDIPVVGKALGTVAETLNATKNILLPGAEVLGLSALALSVPLLSSLSPLVWYGEIMMGVAGGFLLGLSHSAWLSVNKEKASGKDLVKLVVEEALRDYEDRVLTQENIDAHGLLVLNVPITLPQKLKVLLSGQEQKEIIDSILKARLDLYQKRVGNADAMQIAVVTEENRWVPVYLPSRGHAAQVLASVAVGDEEVEHLSISSNEENSSSEEDYSQAPPPFRIRLV